MIAGLLEPSRLPALGPGRRDSKLAMRLRSLSAADLFSHARVTDTSMAAACLAGLWLHADGLDESHAISQTIENATGSFWHGIMHRREGDFGNAKYWFRRVGQHPVFGSLGVGARELAKRFESQEGAAIARQSSWDAGRWIDLCQLAQESSHSGPTVQGADLVDFCLNVQVLEWGLLFDYSYQRAVS
ncbi:MAG: hypothetical protein K2Y37_07790 [Pirellulales bacterium]|nr:hypothetical protein [Pirellulales bacterium]